MNALSTLGTRLLGSQGYRLAISRQRLLDGRESDITAEEWPAAWRAFRARMFPGVPEPGACYRCEGAGHYAGRLCEVCEGFTWLRERDASRECRKCGGHGHVRRDLPVGHPQFGSVGPCSECGSRGAGVLGSLGPLKLLGMDPAIALAQAHVPQSYRGHSIDSLLARPSITGSQIAAATLVAAWSELAPAFLAQHDGRTGVVLSGPVGTMKTGLAVGGLAEAAMRVQRPRFASWLGLLAMLRQSWNHGDGGMSQMDIVTTYGRARVLVLDDFGVVGSGARQPEHAIELAEAIWDARVGMSEAWTLVTTNLPDWSALASEFGDRVVSRMRSCCVWQGVEGSDTREGSA